MGLARIVHHALPRDSHLCKPRGQRDAVVPVDAVCLRAALFTSLLFATAQIVPTMDQPAKYLCAHYSALEATSAPLPFTAVTLRFTAVIKIARDSR